MPKLTETDAKVTLMEQMETDVSPVVLINRFGVAPGEVDQLAKAWAADGRFLQDAAGLHFRAALPGHRRQLRVRQCRGLGVGRTFRARFHAPASRATHRLRWRRRTCSRRSQYQTSALQDDHAD
jgi:hypothetical protein